MADNKIDHRNKGGRPPKTIAEKRTAEVKFHVTPDVKRRLQNEAIIAGTDLATYCRDTCRRSRTGPTGEQPEPVGTDCQHTKGNGRHCHASYRTDRVLRTVGTPYKGIFL